METPTSTTSSGADASKRSRRIPSSSSPSPTPDRADIASAYRAACEDDSSGTIERYYLLPAKWMETFLQHAASTEKFYQSTTTTSYEEKKENSVSSNSPPLPSKITNNSLLSSNLDIDSELKPGLEHGKDYALVGPKSWKVLKCYGFDVEIPRKVVDVGSSTAVEVYSKKARKRNEDGKLSASLVTLPLSGRWDLPRSSRWEDNKEMVYEDGSGEDALSSESTHATSQLSSEDPPTTISAPISSPLLLPPVSSSSPPYNRQLALVSLTPQATKEREPLRKKTRKLGRCGLGNLGNTCFMNSTLQCLAHTHFLREYFLTGNYRADLNCDNPLGTGGELATEFAKLMEQMWGGAECDGVIYPRQFKYTLGRHAEQFIGYDQHDSQELAAHLLDALHEDTNRVTKKPYIEKPEQTENESDAEAAEKAWSLHLQREDSKVLEGFMGQVKSRVQCPNPHCGRVSTTFDPFMYLSVPIPGATERTITVTFVPLDPDEKKRKLNITLSKASTIANLQQKIAEQVGIEKDDIYIADVWSDEIYTFFQQSDDISRIRESDQTHSFQLAPLSSIRALHDEEDEVGAEIAIVENDEWEGLNLDAELDPVTVLTLNKEDNWMKTMERYSKSPTLSHFLNHKRSTHDDRMGFLKKLHTFLQTLSKCPDAQSNPSEENCDALTLEEVSSQHHTFRNVKTQKDLLTLSFCANKFHTYSLKLLKESRQKLKDGVIVQILFKSDSNPRVSSLEKVFAAPMVLRLGSKTTVHDLRKLLGDRLRNVLSTTANVPLHPPAMVVNDDDADTVMESPMDISEPSPLHNQKPQDNIYPMNDPSETLLLRRIPLTYQKKSFYSYTHSTSHQLGSLSHTSHTLAIPNDPAENEIVAEVVGNQGTINLHWTNQLVEDTFDTTTWNHIEPPEPSPLPPPSALSVSTCIEKYCHIEQLEETEMWYCNRCKSHVRAWKQFHLYRTPPILIIHLKRFHYSSSTHRRDKIDAFIDFPLKGLDLRDKVMNWREGEEPIYDCYAVSNHYGGLGGGHYTAYAKNNGDWCHFDDCRVTEGVTEAEVISPAAYVLYYKRRDSETDQQEWDRDMSGSASVGDSVDGEMFEEEYQADADIEEYNNPQAMYDSKSDTESDTGEYKSNHVLGGKDEEAMTIV